jgi:tripartite-type tricarboxylate transporter receptor subunit TctC
MISVMYAVRSRLILLFALMALAMTAPLASAQVDPSYPSRPIRFIVPFPGLVENLARIIGERMGTETRQSVLIEPRPGANGIVAAQFVAAQPADGYVVLFTTNTTQAANPTIYSKLPYDPVKDFAPVTGVAKGALLYVGSTELGAANIPDVVGLARKRPGQLAFGWAGSSGRAAIEMLNLEAHLNMRNVPYKSAPQALVDLVGGHIDLLVYADIAEGMQLGRAGKLRVLGVSTAERLEAIPDVPTVREQGFPDFEMSFWAAAYVPAKTPVPVIARLNSLIASGMQNPRFRDVARSTGMIPMPTTPEALAAFQLAETDKWRRIVTAAGMQEP